MSAVLTESYPVRAVHKSLPVVVIGTGPVGIRFVEELVNKDPESPVIIYGNEPWEPYNRVRLTGLLTGEYNLQSIQNPLKLNAHHQVIQHHNCEIVSIDRHRQLVIDREGRCQSYFKLVLATGSTPHVPMIEGISKSGVYTFRNLDDVQNLLARSTRSRRTIVLGGGLLGLEAARGLQKYNTEVTVIDHSGHLMAQQLDEEAGALLREHIMSQNIQVLLGNSVKQVLGEDQVKGVILRSGRELECDTIVVAAGIKPNLELARVAGIAVGRGIRVNDQMQTSDSNVYAIGECCEHRDKIYGLVAPGLEQARVAAHHLTGGTSHYPGAQSITRLKVAGVSVFSVGPGNDRYTSMHQQALHWRSVDNRSYRKIILHRNRLVGAIAYGEWAESSRIQEMSQYSRYIWPWQRLRFLRDGNLWSPDAVADVNAWPASAIVCQCTQINRGALSKAVQAGCQSVEALCEKTGASSVCGSCKPLLADLLGKQEIPAEKGSRVLVWTGIMSLLVALVILLAPAIPFAESVQEKIQLDQLWRNSLFKQISGFTLLAIGIIVSLISLRKRIKSMTMGDFGTWRVLHVVLGAIAVFTLLAHTGFRLGFNINLYLMLCFLGLILVGSIASGVIGLQHIIPRKLAGQAREISLWAHILLLWPLPALLGFHILKSYWF